MERDIRKDEDLLPFEPPRDQSIGFAEDLPEPIFEDENTYRSIPLRPFKTVKGRYKLVGRIRPLPYRIDE